MDSQYGVPKQVRCLLVYKYHMYCFCWIHLLNVPYFRGIDRLSNNGNPIWHCMGIEISLPTLLEYQT